VSNLATNATYEVRVLDENGNISRKWNPAINLRSPEVEEESEAAASSMPSSSSQGEVWKRRNIRDVLGRWATLLEELTVPEPFGTVEVELTNDADGQVIADGLRLERIE
jgi:hypothetical protein